MPEDITGMGRFFKRRLPLVGIEDRAAKSDMVGTVPITTLRHVPAGQDKFERVSPRFPEDRDRLVVAKSTHVILELLVPAIQPVGVGHPLEDVAHQDLLVSSKKAALDRGPGDLPVILQPCSQQATCLVHMVPGKADFLSLLGVERLVKTSDQGFGNLLASPGSSIGTPRQGDAGGRQCQGTCLPEKGTPRLPGTIVLLTSTVIQVIHSSLPFPG